VVVAEEVKSVKVEKLKNTEKEFKYIINTYLLCPTLELRFFIGMCLNIYASIAIINSQTVWLDKRMREDRKAIIEEIKKAAAK
jgi:hypothetical protein